MKFIAAVWLFLLPIKVIAFIHRAGKFSAQLGIHSEKRSCMSAVSADGSDGFGDSGGRGEISNEEDEAKGRAVLAEEPMYSISYDPLELPNQATFERDLEDMLMERSMRFVDEKKMQKQHLMRNMEMCYLVGLEDKSQLRSNNPSGMFTLEESLTELSELAGAAGLTVVGSTYQRVTKPNIQYYIGQGKTRDIHKQLTKLRCTCVIFDTELTPSQQKNLELSFNNQQGSKSSSKKNYIKVVDRTALILDIFAQHAKTREGQLQVQLAQLTYRLPRLTNMWTHLERQSAGSKGRSNGGVGLRGPGETQLESDRRQMKAKISALKKTINDVRSHRSRHRHRRRQLGVPVVALVGYTNSGKSTLLNSLVAQLGQKGGQRSSSGKGFAFVADMLFATLDPTTRMVRTKGMKNPDILLSDTVGFIQKLPTNLIAAFRATLEEITEADVLLHVTDITNEAWKKQESSVLMELSNMGLADKPVVTVWNKIDAAPETKEFLKFEAEKRPLTIAMSARTGEGAEQLLSALEVAVSSQMNFMSFYLPYEYNPLLDTLYRLAVLEEVTYTDESIFVKGNLPRFLCQQIESLANGDDSYVKYFSLQARKDFQSARELENDSSSSSEFDDDEYNSNLLDSYTDSDNFDIREDDSFNPTDVADANADTNTVNAAVASVKDRPLPVIVSYDPNCATAKGNADEFNSYIDYIERSITPEAVRGANIGTAASSIEDLLDATQNTGVYVRTRRSSSNSSTATTEEDSNNESTVDYVDADRSSSDSNDSSYSSGSGGSNNSERRQKVKKSPASAKSRQLLVPSDVHEIDWKALARGRHSTRRKYFDE